MMTEVDAAIKVMAEQINPNITADAALKFSQAALNLAHTKNILHIIEVQKTSGSTAK